jgi:RNA-binding protein YlmH
VVLNLISNQIRTFAQIGAAEKPTIKEEKPKNFILQKHMRLDNVKNVLKKSRQELIKYIAQKGVLAK